MPFAPSNYCFQPYRGVHFKAPPKIVKAEPQVQPKDSATDNAFNAAGDGVPFKPEVTVEQLKREIAELRVEVSSLSCKLNTVLSTRSHVDVVPNSAPVSVTVNKSAKKYEDSCYAGFECDNHYAENHLNPYSQISKNTAVSHAEVNAALKTDASATEITTALDTAPVAKAPAYVVGGNSFYQAEQLRSYDYAI